MSRQRRHRQTQRRILEAMAKAQAEGRLRLGEVYMLTLRHDNGCDLIIGRGQCSCHPEICEPERVPSPEEN